MWAYEIAPGTLSGLSASSDTREKAYHDTELLSEAHLKFWEACIDGVPAVDTLTLEREHVAYSYCRHCLFDSFTMALDDVSIFLPKCWRVLTSLDVCGKIVPKEHIKKTTSW